MDDGRIFCECCRHWVDEWLQGTEDFLCADCESEIHDE